MFFHRDFLDKFFDKEWLLVALLIVTPWLLFDVLFDQELIWTNKKINKKKIYIEQTTISLKYSRGYKNFVFNVNNQEFKATCSQISAASENYSIICDRNQIDRIIEVKDIEFLDIVYPKHEGVFLKGRFLIDGKELIINVDENSSHVEDAIQLKKVDIGIMYLFTVVPLAYIFLFVSYIFICIFKDILQEHSSKSDLEK